MAGSLGLKGRRVVKGLDQFNDASSGKGASAAESPVT
jgi:hypothetical protein